MHESLLEGFTVGVTAARRGEEIADLLRSQGANVVTASVLQSSAVADRALQALTAELIADPPDHLIVTTSFGFQSWLAAADTWGLGLALREALSTSSIHARGPKSVAAVVSEGLKVCPTSASPAPSMTIDALVKGLIAGGVSGSRIAFQHPGEESRSALTQLAEAGADVLSLKPYVWAPSLAPSIEKLIRQTIGAKVDAIVFTSAPAVGFLLSQAEAVIPGSRQGLVTALRNDVLACCVGPVTAAALEALSIPTLVASQPRIGVLVHELCVELPVRRCSTLQAGGHTIEIRGHRVRVDGAPIDLAPAPLSTLRALALRPGHVVSRAELKLAAPDGSASDDHAVEVTVARLRLALGHNRIIQTVVKRGYRLAVDG